MFWAVSWGGGGHGHAFTTGTNVNANGSGAHASRETPSPAAQRLNRLSRLRRAALSMWWAESERRGRHDVHQTRTTTGPA